MIMKLLIYVKIVLSFVMLLSISACEILDDIDDNTSECYQESNQISPSVDIPFRHNCYVKWKDGTVATDLSVKYLIHKEYCNGDTSGFYEVYVPNRITDSAGSWDSHYIATYTFKNKKDRVFVKFIIAPGAYDWEYEYILRWEDVDEANELEYGTSYRTFYITLPINEDGS